MASRAVIACVAAILTVLLLFRWQPVPSRSFDHDERAWAFNFTRDAVSHSLNVSQCDTAFPDLYRNIDHAVKTRTHNSDWISPDHLHLPRGRCMLRVLIYEKELRIIDLGDPMDCYVSNGRERIMATLSLIHRALSSTPIGETIPNIEFPISYDDMPTRSTAGVTLGFTRMQDQQDVWLIPDYGYWSWWAIGIPSFMSLWRQMEELESSRTWQEKISKAIWRGTTHYNPAIREKLLETTEDTVWGDVQTISKGEYDENFVALSEHCKFQYVLHAEGTSYSGRLKFLQLCNSVTVAHKMDWAEFATHLMRPDGPDQNFIEVERDWSNLPQKMNHFSRHSDDAKMIAQRSFNTFNRRYLTPAAVSCYLRRLFYGWAQVQNFDPQVLEPDTRGGMQLRGIPFEALLVSFPQDRPGEYEG